MRLLKDLSTPKDRRDSPFRRLVEDKINYHLSRIQQRNPAPSWPLHARPLAIGEWGYVLDQYDQGIWTHYLILLMAEHGRNTQSLVERRGLRRNLRQKSHPGFNLATVSATIQELARYGAEHETR